MFTGKFKVGDNFYCKYPQHGVRNITCNQSGKIVASGKSRRGAWCTIERTDGSYRTLSASKMVSPLMFESV